MGAWWRRWLLFDPVRRGQPVHNAGCCNRAVAHPPRNCLENILVVRPDRDCRDRRVLSAVPVAIEGRFDLASAACGGQPGVVCVAVDLASPSRRTCLRGVWWRLHCSGAGVAVDCRWHSPQCVGHGRRRRQPDRHGADRVSATRGLTTRVARALCEATDGVGLSGADSEGAIAQFLARNPGTSYVALDDAKLVASILILITRCLPGRLG